MTVSRAKRSKKSGGKGSEALMKSRVQRAAELQVDFTEELRFSKGTLNRAKFRERKGPSQGVIQKCELQERSPCAPKFNKGRNLATRTMRPQRSMGFGDQCPQAQ